MVEIYRPGSEIAPLRRCARPRSRRPPPRSDRSRCAPPMSRWRANSARCRSLLSTPRKARLAIASASCAPTTIRGCNCPAGSARAASRFIERSTLACALDRLTLLSAGSEPKVGALFAQAELNRSYCGQRDPILASTPKYTTAMEGAGDPPGAAAHWPLSDRARYAARGDTISTKSHSMRLPRCSAVTISRRAACVPFNRLTGGLIHPIIFE